MISQKNMLKLQGNTSKINKDTIILKLTLQSQNNSSEYTKLTKEECDYLINKLC